MQILKLIKYFHVGNNDLDSIAYKISDQLLSDQHDGFYKASLPVLMLLFVGFKIAQSDKQGGLQEGWICKNNRITTSYTSVWF